MTLRTEILVWSERENASRAGASRFAERACRCVDQHGRFNVALSGGNTPRDMYRMLAMPPLRERIPWHGVHLFWGDDRAVPPDHARSNYGMAHDAFIKAVPIPSTHVHRMHGELSATLAATLYESELRAHFGDELPRFDLIHLGVGADGHTASLFPGAAELEIVDRMVVASLDRSRDEPRITFTLPVINAAAAVEFLVLDEARAEVVADVITGSSRGRTYPARRVAPEGQLAWLLSEPASRVLFGHGDRSTPG